MNIGLDIDGVLTDIHGFNLRHAPLYFRRKFGREVIDEDENDIRDIFKCPDNEWMSYWRRFLIKYVTLEPSRKGAETFTRKLQEDGHRVFIISKRVFAYRQDLMGLLMRGIVRNWLWRNGIVYNELIFCDAEIPDSKKPVCLDKSIDVMIDDEPLNINFIVSVAKAICFETSYNLECSGENIFRAKDYNEAYNFICNLRGE